MTKLSSAHAIDSVEIAARAAQARAANPSRVIRLEHDGRVFWVKSQERLGLRMRLQKGAPRRAFAAERAALGTLIQLGLPVPEVVAEGPDFFVTADCGPSLRDILRDPKFVPSARPAVFVAAAAALAGFHAKGVSHGRPSIKDIAWDGRRAVLLDFERYHSKRNTLSGHAQDVVILLFSAFAEIGRDGPETQALAEAYRAADPGGVWQAAARLCRRLAWVDPLTKPVQRLKRAREFRAIPLTLRAFGAA